ncbi:hypothetical protein ACN8ZM_40025 (plasmid) [Burkholderia aenigmatica]|uniref:hypothetical protein n=1 Tax=Burkholderia aenigmatica TaxID=2015348 RepID=UPI003B431AB1
MDVGIAIFTVGILVGSALWYIGRQMMLANVFAAARIEFEIRNASWTPEQRKEFEDEVGKAFKR